MKHVGFLVGKKFEGLSASSVQVGGAFLTLVNDTSLDQPI